MTNKEATARIKINKLLETAGRRFFAEGAAPANIRLEPGVTIKSSDLDALGENFEKTSKGFMWRDIGLNDWLFTLDNEEEIPRVAPAVLAMAKDPAGAKAKVAKAAEIVKARQTAMMDAVKKSAAV